MWDLSRIGAEQSAEDAEDGPPELLVMFPSLNHFWSFGHGVLTFLVLFLLFVIVFVLPAL